MRATATFNGKFSSNNFSVYGFGTSADADVGTSSCDSSDLKLDEDHADNYTLNVAGSHKTIVDITKAAEDIVIQIPKK